MKLKRKKERRVTEEDWSKGKKTKNAEIVERRSRKEVEKESKRKAKKKEGRC